MGDTNDGKPVPEEGIPAKDFPDLDLSGLQDIDLEETEAGAPQLSHEDGRIISEPLPTGLCNTWVNWDDTRFFIVQKCPASANELRIAKRRMVNRFFSNVRTFCRNQGCAKGFYRNLRFAAPVCRNRQLELRMTAQFICRR